MDSSRSHYLVSHTFSLSAITTHDSITSTLLLSLASSSCATTSLILPPGFLARLARPSFQILNIYSLLDLLRYLPVASQLVLCVPLVHPLKLMETDYLEQHTVSYSTTKALQVGCTMQYC